MATRQAVNYRDAARAERSSQSSRSRSTGFTRIRARFDRESSDDTLGVRLRGQKNDWDDCWALRSPSHHEGTAPPRKECVGSRERPGDTRDPRQRPSAGSCSGRDEGPRRCSAGRSSWGSSWSRTRCPRTFACTHLAVGVGHAGPSVMSSTLSHIRRLHSSALDGSTGAMTMRAPPGTSSARACMAGKDPPIVPSPA